METPKAQNHYTNTENWKCIFKMHVVDNSDSYSHMTHMSSRAFSQNLIKKDSPRGRKKELLRP